MDAADLKELAQWLEKHELVESVNYPGLPQHPGHAIARSQMHGFGAIVSFVLKGGVLLAGIRTSSDAEPGLVSGKHYGAIERHARVSRRAAWINRALADIAP